MKASKYFALTRLSFVSFASNAIKSSGHACRNALLLIALLLLGLFGCAPTKNWPQFHADGSNQGSLLEATSFALRPSWEFDVGPFDDYKPLSSPVVGPNGTIYIGNLSGDIIAVNSSGTELWRATTPFRIFSTPAVAEDGTIYAVGTSFFPDAGFPDTKFRSTLITIAPDGTVLDLSPIPDQGYTGGSPKVWTSGRENYIFLHANTRRRFSSSRSNALFVFNRDGDLIAREDLGCSVGVTGGTGFLNLLKDFIQLFIVEFDPSGPEPSFDPDDYPWIDPTVAVVERDDIAGPDNAIVVVADQACSDLWAFRWDAPELQRLWFVDEDDKFIASSSPAVLNGAALVVIGRADDKVMAYDLATGDKSWTYDAEEPVLGTPASHLRHIYVTSSNRIQALEPSTGEGAWKSEFHHQWTHSSPALSASHVYFNTSAEFKTFDLVLDVAGHDTPGGFHRGGSPAIAGDGSVYTLVVIKGDRNRVILRAYPDR
jgi:outer membrane protein assembly factor BamB